MQKLIHRASDSEYRERVCLLRLNKSKEPLKTCCASNKVSIASDLAVEISVPCKILLDRTRKLNRICCSSMPDFFQSLDHPEKGVQRIEIINNTSYVSLLQKSNLGQEWIELRRFDGDQDVKSMNHEFYMWWSKYKVIRIMEKITASYY